MNINSEKVKSLPKDLRKEADALISKKFGDAEVVEKTSPYTHTFSHSTESVTVDSMAKAVDLLKKEGFNSSSFVDNYFSGNSIGDKLRMDTPRGATVTLQGVEVAILSPSDWAMIDSTMRRSESNPYYVFTFRFIINFPTGYPCTVNYEYDHGSWKSVAYNVDRRNSFIKIASIQGRPAQYVLDVLISTVHRLLNIPRFVTDASNMKVPLFTLTDARTDMPYDYRVNYKGVGT